MPDEKPDVSDLSDVTDVYSDARGENKLHSFLRTARLALPGKVLHLWNPERQQQAATHVHEVVAIDLRVGEL